MSNFSNNVSLDPKSDAALDAEDNLRNMWFDHEQEVKEILSNFSEISVYGTTK